jgi:hypothetical protein
MGRLVLVRRRFWKKVSKVLMACCVGDPSVRKGAAGRGLRSSVTRFSNASVMRSVEDVAGMGNGDLEVFSDEGAGEARPR